MADKTVAERLREVIADYSGIAADRITDDADIYDDLGIDSLEKVELAMMIEDEFGIEVHDSDLTRADTVADLSALVTRAS